MLALPVIAVLSPPRHSLNINQFILTNSPPYKCRHPPCLPGPISISCHHEEVELHLSWLSLLPRRFIPGATGLASFAVWHSIQVRTPGTARRRPSAIGSPHSVQCVRLSPLGILARAIFTASAIVSSIWSCTDPSGAQPVAILKSLSF